jgi:hypothetical protein
MSSRRNCGSSLSPPCLANKGSMSSSLLIAYPLALEPKNEHCMHEDHGWTEWNCSSTRGDE